MILQKEYFEWICEKVDGHDYTELLNIMYETEFYPLIPQDENRLIDGCDLMYRFSRERDIPKVVIDKTFGYGSCSILEMMLGLAVRIEETIMEDADFGDRTAIWFWIMVKSLGLYNMKNDTVDTEYVNRTLETFLNRGYESNGEGGLFTVRDTNKDMRDVEIWYQMCMFFDNLL